ncbi:Viral IAP-associated factor, partial [Tetrabaena socialis]
NLPPKEPKWKPDPYAPKAEVARDESWVAGRDEAELKDAEEAFEDDRFFEQYRSQLRVTELQEAAAPPRFSGVDLIRGSEFVQQVTNAGPDVWVVLHLFKDGHAGCGLLQQCLDELAGKYPHTKFLRILSTDAIPNYPDANLPTLLVYHDTRCLQHAVGLGHFGGQKRITPEQVGGG